MQPRISSDDVRRFLERYGAALSSGDINTIVESWEVPALVLAAQGAMSVAADSEVERFFTMAVANYHERGMASTRPEILKLEPLSERIAMVVVRWPAFDASGVEKGSETSSYVLRVGDDGQPRIRVAVTIA